MRQSSRSALSPTASGGVAHRANLSAVELALEETAAFQRQMLEVDPDAPAAMKDSPQVSGEEGESLCGTVLELFQGVCDGCSHLVGVPDVELGQFQPPAELPPRV